METPFTGKRIIFLPRVDSTNSYAIELLKNVNLPEGTLIHTAHQTEGRGQRGTQWLSDPDTNITISVILRPLFLPLNCTHYLTLISALAVYRTIIKFMPRQSGDIRIKWPNDVLFQRKKLAGILIENNIQNQNINWSIAGIGINVNTPRMALETATSMMIETGARFNLETVLSTLYGNLEEEYMRLRSGELQEIRSDYLSRLYGMNERLQFKTGSIVSHMTVRGIDDEGQLIVERDNGERWHAGTKDLTWLLQERPTPHEPRDNNT